MISMEIKTPIVSILIPTRNRVNKLKKCLDNLFKTCYDKYNFEVLCGVDNSSPFPHYGPNFMYVEAIINS